MNNALNPNEVRALRRLAARRGLRVWVVAQRSRNFSQYGPLSLIAADTNALVVTGLVGVEQARQEVARWAA